MKTCRLCSWPLTPASSRGDIHRSCVKSCRICGEELVEGDQPDECRICAFGPNDSELNDSDYSAPSAMELHKERNSL